RLRPTPRPKLLRKRQPDRRRRMPRPRWRKPPRLRRMALRSRTAAMMKPWPRRRLPRRRNSPNRQPPYRPSRKPNPPARNPCPAAGPHPGKPKPPPLRPGRKASPGRAAAAGGRGRSATPDPGSRPSAARPGREAGEALLHVGGRASIGETQRRMTARRVEIEARRRRDARLGEEPPREVAAVSGQIRNVGVDVEGAVGRRDPPETGLRQPFEEEGAIAAVDREIFLELLRRVHCRECGDLACVRGADEEILHQPLDPPYMRLRHHHPA